MLKTCYFCVSHEQRSKLDNLLEAHLNGTLFLRVPLGEDFPTEVADGGELKELRLRDSVSGGKLVHELFDNWVIEIEEQFLERLGDFLNLEVFFSMSGKRSVTAN